MRFISLIPARSGSKGLPNKNIKELNGKPLLAWTIESSLSCSSIEKTIVSTDSQQYADIAISYGAEVPFLRPAEFSQDSSTDLQMVLHFIDWIQSESLNFDGIIHLRPTTPFREVTVLEKAIELFIREYDDITCLRSVEEMSETAYKSYLVEEGRLNPIIKGWNLDKVNQPRQAFPKTFSANGYIDILKLKHIVKKRDLHGNEVLPFHTSQSIEIDNEMDFNKASWFSSNVNNLGGSKL